ncbi:GNAT family N-acetyltransferase [Hyphomicrobium facile]|uniref:Acetyltransferase involved in cellulose biosynthesis, CelD/BcsL family n=1 Tax=Hyphomicrobium facile TaxID=51670 RepID=A0A1I7NV75_9HYPH|nr:GNAT family N-acetyltransferase [Hyphomicrobium facile]SFV38561.1 Acetyltransferase involved in cellulose biosynthesis, CelD/BcsL family [Hyphomicrobium facile]
MMTTAARALTSFERPTIEQCRAVAAVHPTFCEFDLIMDRAAFDALETEWNDLFAKSGKPANVFQTFNFCWHWANHYLRERNGQPSTLKLLLITARRDDRLIMVFPLVSERMRGITQVFWMGGSASQYGDALIENVPDKDAILRAAFDLLRSQSGADILRLRRVREDANVTPLMNELGATAAERLVAPYMDLTSAADFPAFEQRYSSKTRKNRRRLFRRLEEKGPMQFLRLHGGDEARQLAVEALGLKSEWLKSRGLLSNAIADRRMADLFADLAEGKTKPAGCIVSALKSNGEIAALEVSFACKARIAMHLIAFNLEYEKSGAGVLLLEQSLKDGYAEGLEACDMLAPGDGYKFDWCEKADPVVDWVMPLTLKGEIYARVYLGFLRARIKTAVKKLPKPLRRLMRDGAKIAAAAER